MTTFILTGLWGSGKTMVARILSDLGIRMDLAPGGISEDFEDEVMHYHLTYFPHTLPMHVIQERDEVHPHWGFKHAAAWNYLSPGAAHQIFRNPRVILMHRDAVCLKGHTGMDLRDIEEEMTRALHWCQRLECPVLHLSSEKLFRDPVGTTGIVQGFIGGRETVDSCNE